MPTLQEKLRQIQKLKKDFFKKFKIFIPFSNKFFVFFKFVEKCKQAGIKVPIIPGIKILSSEAHLTKLPKYFFLDIPNELSNQVIGRDKNEIREVGIKWAQNQVHELLEFGVPCVHFYIMSSAKSVVEVLSEF